MIKIYKKLTNFLRINFEKLKRGHYLYNVNNKNISVINYYKWLLIYKKRKVFLNIKIKLLKNKITFSKKKLLFIY